MDNRRRCERIPTDIKLHIESLYKQDHVILGNINEDIQVVDVSKTGIGFTSSHQLPIGYYFNAKISFNEEKFFYSVLKILRVRDEGDIFHYGCEFVGLADILANTVDEYAEEVHQDVK